MLGVEFTKEQIKVATNDFSPDRLIGKGGYSTVYWGYINCSLVAVEVLNEV